MAPPDIDPKILLALGLGALQGCGGKVGPCLDIPVETGDPDTDATSTMVGPCLNYAIETGETGIGPCLDYPVETGETGLGPCLDYYYPPDTSALDTGADTGATSSDRQQSAKVVLPTSNSERLRQSIRRKLLSKGILPSNIDFGDDKQ